MQDVLGEVIKLFPGTFIHVGGDEAIKDQWKASPQVQVRLKELELKDEHELQSYFIRRMDTFLTTKGRRLIGWDEILEGGLAPGATVVSWHEEYLPTPGHVEYMAFPRLIALSEVTWSSKERKNYPDFLTRLGVHEERLQYLNVNFRSIKKPQAK